MWVPLLLASVGSWLAPTVVAQSVSDETTQSSGLLGLASLLPAARYGTPHLSQLVGTRVTCLNPFLNGWFIGAYSGLVSGKPAENEFGQVSASVSGASIAVTSPFVFDVLQSIDEDDRDADYAQLRTRGLGWQITVATVSNLVLPPHAQTVNVIFTLLLYAVPIVCMAALGDYSGVGSVVYVTFGLAVRLVENATHVSIEPRQNRANNPMGLLYKPSASPSVVLLHADEGALNPVNIEDLVHPRLGVRFLRSAAACSLTYRVSMGALLSGWLAFLVTSSRSSTSYTNGYIELATLAVSALGEVLMQRLVVGTVHVRTVRKRNAITVIAWLARRRFLDAPGVPNHLLQLNDDETALVRALFRNEVEDALWDRVLRCDREQVFFDEDGSELVP